MKKLNALLLCAIAALGLSSCSFEEVWDKVKDTTTGAVDSVKDLFNKDKDEDQKDKDENQGGNEGENQGGEGEDEPHSHTFASEWSYDETSHYHAATCEHTSEKTDVGAHEFDSTGHCTVCNYYDESKEAKVVFTDEQLGFLSGKFNASDLVLNVTKDGASVSFGEEVMPLKNVKIEGEKYSTVITYKDATGAECTLSWKQAEYDKHGFGFMLPTLNVGGKEVQFQPDIAEYQGWYDAWGELDYSVVYYILTNNFNSEANMYDMDIFNWSYETCYKDVYFAAISYKDIEGETKLCVSWFDTADLELGFNYVEWNYYFDKDSETGKIQMISMDSEYIEWSTMPGYLVGTYWDDQFEADGLYALGDGMYFICDEGEKTLEFYKNYDLVEEGSYSEGFDENGQFVMFNDKKIRGTSEEMSIETAEGVKNYVPFFTSALFAMQYTAYSTAEESIILETDYETWEENFFVNGEPADYATLTLYEGNIVYKFTKDGNIYYVNPYVSEDFVEVTKNGVSSLYFSEYLSWRFVNNYIDIEDNPFIIDDSYNITYDGQDWGHAEYVYDEYFEQVGLHFPLGDGGMTVFEFYPELGVYCFVGDASYDDYGFLFTEYMGHSYYGTFSDGTVTFEAHVEDGEKIIKYAGKTLNFVKYTLLSGSDGSFVPGVVLVNPLSKIQYTLALFGDSMQLYDTSKGTYDYITVFVDASLFEGVPGEYDFVGQYGIEKVIFTEDGKLYVDTSNATHDGIELIQYAYYPFVTYSGELGLAFDYNETEVHVVFDGNGHASIFDINYVKKEFFDVQGLYGTSADSMLYVVDTNIVYNGEKMYVSEVNGNVFSGSFGMDDATVTFVEGEVVIQIGENDPVTLAMNATQLSSFKTEVHENVGELSRDIKVEDDGVYIRNTGDKEFTKVTDFEYVIDESGNVSIQFVNSLFYTFTISIVEGEVVVTGVSSMPF